MQLSSRVLPGLSSDTDRTSSPCSKHRKSNLSANTPNHPDTVPTSSIDCPSSMGVAPLARSARIAVSTERSEPGGLWGSP